MPIDSLRTQQNASVAKAHCMRLDLILPMIDGLELASSISLKNYLIFKDPPVLPF